MTPISTDFCADLTARGLVHQVNSPQLAELMRTQRFTGYCGFDPTADSLHVGSMLPLLTLVRLQRAGHVPIALIGGGTGLIGDPSGKDSERSLLAGDALAANLAGIRRQIERYLDLSAGQGLLLDNAEWLTRLNLIDFLRDVGKHFSVNVMITRDSVRSRLEGREQGLSYTEFSYALLQSYDFLELFDRHGCTLQLGGSDQWGNMVSGADLIRRLRGVETYALTCPLLLRADGRKFGKSEEGNVWLDPARTSPYHFYQFWLNAEDADVLRLLRIFTLLSPEEIERHYQPLVTERPEQREAQRRLAEETTRFIHGDAALARAQRATALLFSRESDYRELSEQELAEAFQGAPTTMFPAARLGTPEALLVGVLTDTGLYPSRGRAKQDLPSGAVTINNRPATDAASVLAADDLLPGGYIILRKGRKNFHVLKVTP